MAHNSRGWCVYVPSYPAYYGASVSIKSDATTAGNNLAGFNPTPTVLLFWPSHRADMRAVGGVDTGNPQYKDTCINTNATNALFAIGSTFVDAAGNNYKTNSLRAERLRLSRFK